jgi:hypothetical protein
MNIVRVGFALFVTVAFAVLATYMVLHADTKDQTEWQHWVYIFGSVEAIAFAAVGWIFGKEVNRERAEKAEDAAKTAQKDAEETAQKGAHLAGMVKASSRGPQGLQMMGGVDSALKAAVDYADANFP